MFKVYLDDVVGRHSIFQKMGFEYVEKQIALAATSDAGKNLDKAVVFSLDEAVKKVISSDCNSGHLVNIFMMLFKKMSVAYQKIRLASRGDWCDFFLLNPRAVFTQATSSHPEARSPRFVRVLPSKAALSSAHFRPAPIGLVLLHFDFHSCRRQIESVAFMQDVR